MSYADAAKGDSSRSSGNSSRENAYGKFFNGKLLVCMVHGFCCEDVADALHKLGMLRVVTGIQTLDYNRRIDVEISNESVRSKILRDGLLIKYHTVTFSQHGSKDATRVYVHQLPLDIPEQEVRAAFETYGSIGRVQPKVMSYHGKRILNGEWCLHFTRLAKQIPSYVSVRGWTAYVNYRGQPKTCRICDGRGHIARDCPTRNDNGDQEKPKNMDVHDQPPQSEENPEKPGETAAADRVFENAMIEDCQIPTSAEPGQDQDGQERKTQSQAWADSPEENPFEVSSKKPQDDSSSEPATPRSVQRQIFGTDTEISDDEPASSQSIWGDDSTASPKPEVKKPVLFCPRCKVNSHSEEECMASVIEEANKKAFSTGVGKKGKKNNVTFKKFKSDLELVVLRGKNTDGVQYVREMGDRIEAFALYLFLIFGDYTCADRGEIRMSGNQEVMDLWRWCSKSMDKTAAKDRLSTIPGHL